MWTIFAYAKLRRGKSCWLWSIPKCPICGQEHQHGGGSLSQDPRLALTVTRVKHCDDAHPPMDDEKRTLVQQGVQILMVEDPELHGYFLHRDHMVELGHLVHERWRREAPRTPEEARLRLEAVEAQARALQARSGDRAI